MNSLAFDMAMKKGISLDGGKNNNYDEIRWVRVYDTPRKLYYEGEILYWDNQKDYNSLLICNVNVCNIKNNRIKYSTPAMYIPNALKERIVEFSFLDKNTHSNEKKEILDEKEQQHRNWYKRAKWWLWKSFNWTKTKTDNSPQQ